MPPPLPRCRRRQAAAAKLPPPSCRRQAATAKLPLPLRPGHRQAAAAVALCAGALVSFMGSGFYGGDIFIVNYLISVRFSLNKISGVTFNMTYCVMCDIYQAKYPCVIFKCQHKELWQF
jgi:hypothetical protein